MSSNKGVHLVASQECPCTTDIKNAVNYSFYPEYIGISRSAELVGNRLLHTIIYHIISYIHRCVYIYCFSEGLWSRFTLAGSKLQLLNNYGLLQGD